MDDKEPSHLPPDVHVLSDLKSRDEPSSPYSDDFSETEYDAPGKSKEPATDERTGFLADPLDPIEPHRLKSSTSILRWFCMFAAGTGVFLIVALTLILFQKGTAPEPSPSLPAIILASYSQQNISWISEVPDNWQVFRMCNDCGRTPTTDKYGVRYPVPSKNGREASAYLTFIITNYHNLPPYMLFLHGHDQAWHQPERAVDLLRALNFTAVDEQMYIPLTCTVESCESSPDNVLSNGPEEYPDEPLLLRLFKVAPAFWKLVFVDMFHETLPPKFKSDHGAQFAVSAAAIRRRPLEDWVALRRPLLDTDMGKLDNLLRDISIKEWGLGPNRTKETIFGTPLEVDLWAIGVMFEGAWHKIFGQDAVYCPAAEQCRDVFFSGAIDCPAYHEPLETNMSSVDSPEISKRKKKLVWDPCKINDGAMAQIQRENNARLGITEF